MLKFKNLYLHHGKRKTNSSRVVENKIQTAVEWLEEQLYSAKELDLAGVIEQAKEIEKQQKELEFDKGWSKGWDEAVKEYEKNH